jgi:hypothetical protein
MNQVNYRNNIEVEDIVRGMGNTIFEIDDSIDFNNIDPIKLYIRVCMWLLHTIKSNILRGKTKFYGNSSTLHQLAFSTYDSNMRFISGYTNRILNFWKRVNLKAPYELVEDIVTKKDYYLRVTENYNRENLYADVTIDYTVEFGKRIQIVIN